MSYEDFRRQDVQYQSMILAAYIELNRADAVKQWMERPKPKPKPQGK